MTEVLYTDILRVFVNKENLDIWSHVIEEQLYNVRPVTEREGISTDVRIAHDLMLRHLPTPLSKAEIAKLI